MNAAVVTRFNAGDVVEVVIDGEVVSALVLLATVDTVILDACDGRTPFVMHPGDLDDARVFDGLVA
jgi:hypothetical protein